MGNGDGVQNVRGQAVFIQLSDQGQLDLHQTLQSHSELSSPPLLVLFIFSLVLMYSSSMNQ